MITFNRTFTQVDEYKPMKVVHHQRTIPSYFKTDEVKQEMMHKEYNIKITSALVNNFEGCMDWLFNHPFGMSDYNSKKKVRIDDISKDEKMRLEHKPGRATMIFVSDLQTEVLKRECDKANKGNRFGDLFFVPLVGANGLNNETAENAVHYYINHYPDRHIVIFAKNIGSRSFSIPEVYNVCIMINDPSFSSAIQKMCRNQTNDPKNPDKVANVYWFTLNCLANPICPLFELAKRMKDYSDRNQFEYTFLGTANIFMEVDGEEMNMSEMPGNPYQDYLRDTAGTFYRLSENFEYAITNKQRLELYELMESLEFDLSSVCIGTKNLTERDKADAKMFEGKTKVRLGSDGGHDGEGNDEKEAQNLILFTKNTLIAIIMRYKTHMNDCFENFSTDFAQVSENNLTPENVKIIKAIYDKLLEFKLI